MTNVLKNDIVLWTSLATSLVQMRYAISIVEIQNNFFIFIVKGMSLETEYIIKQCRTYLEAGLIWRRLHEEILKNQPGVRFQEARSMTLKGKKMCEFVESFKLENDACCTGVGFSEEPYIIKAIRE